MGVDLSSYLIPCLSFPGYPPFTLFSSPRLRTVCTASDESQIPISSRILFPSLLLPTHLLPFFSHPFSSHPLIFLLHSSPSLPFPLSMRVMSMSSRSQLSIIVSQPTNQQKGFHNVTVSCLIICIYLKYFHHFGTRSADQSSVLFIEISFFST